MSPRLILASASPRRRQLLLELGVTFEIEPSDVPEIPAAGEAPVTFARRVALAKALEIVARQPGAFVLAADTIVVLDDTIFNKPADSDEARRMLRTLSGRTHHVITAVVLINPSGTADELQETTAVTFRHLTDEEIDAYLATGEPFDKAGSYGMQGGGQRFVSAVHGSASNVIGLPIETVAALLRRHLPPECIPVA